MAGSERDDIERELINREMARRAEASQETEAPQAPQQAAQTPQAPQAQQQPQQAAPEDGGVLAGVNNSIGAFKSGLENITTLGHKDEISAGVQAAISGLTETASNFAQGKMELGEFIDVYQEKLEVARVADEAQQKANPISYGAGQVAGSVATAGTMSASGMVGKGVMGAVKSSAAVSGLAAAGESEASLVDGEVERYAGDVGVGAAIGAGTGLVGEAVGAGVGKAVGTVGRFLGKSKSLNKLGTVADDSISAKAVAADLRAAGRTNAKQAFSPTDNKNLEAGIKGLQERGIIPRGRKDFLSLDKRELHTRVAAEQTKVGEAIGFIADKADEIRGPSTNSAGVIKSLRKVTKDIRKGSTSDEFNASIDNVTDLLKDGPLTTNETLGLKREVSALIKKGKNSLSKSRSATLSKLHGQLKESAESKINAVAGDSPEIMAELKRMKAKDFKELNSFFGDTAVVMDSAVGASALADQAEGIFEASPLSEQIGKALGQPGAGSVVTRGLGKAIGATAEGVARGAGKVGRGIKSVANVQQQSAFVARKLYKSLDRNNIIADEGERKAHAGRVMSNPALSNSQKFREVNMLQNDGKINPESVPKKDVDQILREIRKENADRAEEILWGS